MSKNTLARVCSRCLIYLIRDVDNARPSEMSIGRRDLDLADTPQVCRFQSRVYRKTTTVAQQYKPTSYINHEHLYMISR